jgi:hypothetical protein
LKFKCPHTKARTKIKTSHRTNRSLLLIMYEINANWIIDLKAKFIVTNLMEKIIAQIYIALE